MTLNEYFHLIVNKQQKELTMFETLKAHFMSLWTKPTTFADNNSDDVLDYEDGYWGFEIYTPAFTSDGECFPVKHTTLLEPHEGTWMEVLDQILDVMSLHYGYDIKEQVYYSVEYPLNEIDERTGKPFAGYGRCLNDNLLQQLLLAHPEVYESQMFGKPTKDLFR
jgi:hypothetical protein